MAQVYVEKLSGLIAWCEPGLSTTATLIVKHFFSGAALYADGRFCASLTPTGFALKLPETSRDALLQEEGAKGLQYFPNAPVKKAYVVLPQPLLDNQAALCSWLDKSIAYVLTLPPPKKKTS